MHTPGRSRMTKGSPVAASGSRNEDGVPILSRGSVLSHSERFVGTDGAVILSRCDCLIGHDHTYADWVNRFSRDGA